MTIKRFGRLAGSTSAMNAQADTTPANAPTPYETVEPATKMIAYGEALTASGLNRAIGAVAANVEDLLALMDTPATRSEILEPEAGTGPFCGFTALSAVDPAAGVNLGAGARVPTVWMFVGMHESQLGQFVQLAREPEVADAARTAMLRPSDVRVNTAAPASYFPAVPTYQMSPEHSHPGYVPPISAIQSDVAPYAGNPANAVVTAADWDTDGVRLTGTTWSSMHIRTGCYAHVASGSHRGLYMVAAISNSLDTPANDKAVLVHGLHRVVVQGVTTLIPGERVIWSREVGGPTVSQTNSAYVLYVDVTGGDDVIYLSTFSGSDDVTDATPAKADTTAPGAVNRGYLGYQEDEVSGNPGGFLQVGTILTGTIGSATVVSFTPAGAPVRFAPGPAPVGQNILLCSPPGFLLNPMLDFTTGQPGEYRGHCRTLTTVRERLRSGALTATRGSWFDDGAMQQFTPLYQHALESFTQWSRVGFQPVVPNLTAPPGDAFSASSQVLGDGMWVVQVDTVPAGGATLESSGALPGMTLQMAHPLDFINAITDVRIAHCRGNELWLHGVTNASWAAGLDRLLPPIMAASTFTFGVNYEVTAVTYAPYLSGYDRAITALTDGTCTVDPDGVTLTGGGGSLWLTELEVGDQVVVGTRFAIVASITNNTLLVLANPVEQGAVSIFLVGQPYVPGSGLNAAYHAHYSADPLTRGNGGGGRTIQLAGPSSPVVLQADTSTFTGLEMRLPVTGALGGGVGTAAGVLQFKDINASAVDLSSATDTAINALLPQNIIGALNGAGLAVVYGFANAPIYGFALTPGAGVGEVTVTSGVILDDGVVKAVAGVTDWLPDWGLLGGGGIAYYLVWDGTTSSLLWQATAPAAGQAALWQVDVAVAGPFTVSNYRDTRLYLSGVNAQIDVQVGGPNAHFATVGAAMEMVNALGGPGVGFPGRNYRILVRGETAELATIPVLVRGVTILGAPGGSITWAGDFALFDINGSDFTIRDLQISYSPIAVTPRVVLDRIVFTGSTSSITGLLFENVRIDGASRLHGYMMNTAAWSKVAIRDCTWEGCTDFGVVLTGVGGFRVAGLDVHTIANGSQAGLFLETGLTCTSCTDVDIRGMRLSYWDNNGITLTGCTRARLYGITILDGTGTDAGVTYYGIQADSTCSDIWIVDCRAGPYVAYGPGIAQAVVAVGIYVDATHVVLRGNHTEVPPGIATRQGILLGPNSLYNIIDENQTRTYGLTLAGGPHSIGALNRND